MSGSEYDVASGTKDRMTRKNIELAAGTLSVAVDRSDFDLDWLCGFASRRNPKRPFLFVSRVLGRHLPVSPNDMRLVYRKLAAKLPRDLVGPVLVVGLAETAICLGQGVFDAWQDIRDEDDLLYIHSTRYRLRRPLLATFEESHSHATSHLIYQPEEETSRNLVKAGRTLLLIDDEASTGSTFLALAKALGESMPYLQDIVCVTITDWMGSERRNALAAQMPVRTRFVSLLEGGYGFESSGSRPPLMPNVTGGGEEKDGLLPINWGRLGIRRSAPLPKMAEKIVARPGETILVLGTGEFVYPPFLLAERLAHMGAEIRVQATTRSPILEGGAIKGVLEFPDSYQDGIPNYLYSVQPGQYDSVYVCYETPPETWQQGLLSALNAIPVYFGETP